MGVQPRNIAGYKHLAKETVLGVRNPFCRKGFRAPRGLRYYYFEDFVSCFIYP